MADITTAFWGMTINKYDETDLAMVHNGYPDHMRELVHTLEEGKEGTKHIQAYLKLKRQQRMSFVKKLFPRAHFKALTSAEYIENTKRYAQKLDDTARSAATHKFFDPVHTIEGLVRKVIFSMIEDWEGVEDIDVARKTVEDQMVIEDYTRAKIFVSASYRQMWKTFGHQMYQCLFHEKQKRLEEEQRVNVDTHTDTHTHREKIFSHEDSITDDEGEDGTQSTGRDSPQPQVHWGEDSEGEDHEAYSSGSEGDRESHDDSGSGDEICL